MDSKRQRMNVSSIICSTTSTKGANHRKKTGSALPQQPFHLPLLQTRPSAGWILFPSSRALLTFFRQSEVQKGRRTHQRRWIFFIWSDQGMKLCIDPEDSQNHLTALKVEIQTEASFAFSFCILYFWLHSSLIQE